MADETASSRIPAHIIDGADQALKSMQQLILAAGKTDDRTSAEFEELKGLYKLLGTSVHEARKQAEAARPTPKKAAKPMTVELLEMPKFVKTMGPRGKGVAMGVEIAHLQRLLTQLGYKVEESKVYDKETLEAVQAFQKDHGLKPSGVVGADMRGLLNQMVTG